METVAPDRETRIDRACYAGAAAVTLGWFFCFAHFFPDYLVDEAGHLGNVYHFLENKPGWPEQMTMLPGYHFIVAALWQLHPPLTLLTLARLVTTITALLALAVFALAYRRVHGGTAGRATLLLSLLPILQPFTGMAYTDVPALAFVFAAFSAQLAGYRIVAALLFIAAVGIRQTNLTWAAFVVAWEFLRPDAPRREFVARTRWMLVVLAAGAAIVLVTGRFTVGTQTGTSLRPNIATLHFAAILALLLGLPVWLAHLPATLRHLRDLARIRPLLVSVGITAAIGATALFALTFANPHMWNRDLFWPGCTFTLLRNWPLVWIDRHQWLRVASGLNVVLMGVALFTAFASQRHRTELWLACAFGALLPFSTNLVEPRYFIPVAAFVLLFFEFTATDWRRLACWWAILCLLHAPFIAKGLSLW